MKSSRKKLAIISVAAFSLAAFIMVLLVYTTDSIEMRWAIVGGALGLFGAGLAVNGFIMALHSDEQTEQQMNELKGVLSRIEALQNEILKEQKEQAKSNSPMGSSLQAVLQYYTEYLTKRQNGSE